MTGCMIQVSVALSCLAHSPDSLLGYEPIGTDGNDQQHQADREQHRKRQAKQSIDVTVGLLFHASWMGPLAPRRRLCFFIRLPPTCGTCRFASISTMMIERRKADDISESLKMKCCGHRNRHMVPNRIPTCAK